MSEVTTGLALKAVVRLVGPEGVFDPRLPDLLKALGVTRAAAHAIEIVHDDGVKRAGQLNKIHELVSGIAGSRAHAKADLGPAAAKLLQTSDVTDPSRDDVGPGVKTFRSA